MAVFASRLDGLLAKLESTYATDPTPVAGTDGVQVEERIFPELGVQWAFENERENAASGSLFSVTPGEPGGRFVTANFSVAARGSGAAYTDPSEVEVDPLLQSCGWSGVHAGGAITYTAGGDSTKSCTLYAYAGNKLYPIVGCRGTFVLSMNPGNIAVYRFTMSGLLNTDPTEVALPSITYQSQIHPAVKNTSLSIGAYATARVAALELDAGVTVQRMDGVLAAEGVDEFAITRHAPRLRYTAYVDALSSFNPYADAEARTNKTFDMTVGGTANNRFDIDINNSVFATPSHVEQQEHTAYEIEHICTDAAIVYD